MIDARYIRMAHNSLVKEYMHIHPGIYVFILLSYSMSNGAEWLLQAHDDQEMSSWLQALRARAAAPAPRSHTLPAPAHDEPKRRSFFTLKKKYVEFQ